MSIKKGYSIAVAVALFTAASATFAADTRATWKGTIPVTGEKHSEAQLKKMAKISQAEATKAALAVVPGKSKKVESIELEAENGYLVYTFDIKVKGKEGIEEVLVDAGDGKVLAQEHEGAAAEAREKKEEAHEKGGKSRSEKSEKSERK